MPCAKREWRKNGTENRPPPYVVSLYGTPWWRTGVLSACMHMHAHGNDKAGNVPVYLRIPKGLREKPFLFLPGRVYLIVQPGVQAVL